VGRHNIVIEDEKGLLDIMDPLHVVSIDLLSPKAALSPLSRRRS